MKKPAIMRAAVSPAMQLQCIWGLRRNSIACKLSIILWKIKKHDMHLTTGNLCTRYVIEVLSNYGYIDAAVEIMTRKDYPSYGYMIECGATTIWELWENATGKAMNSHNHPMFGSVDLWFYKHLASIQLDYRNPAYGHIIFKPGIPSQLDRVEASVDTARGMVRS